MAWRCPVRLTRFLMLSSLVEAALHQNERRAADLLAFHSLTLSYTPTYSLIHMLWGVYHRQVATIAGATLHMISMSHQKYATWATMVVYCMRGHEQRLRTSMASVQDLYIASFRRTTRLIRTLGQDQMVSYTCNLREDASSSWHAYFSEYSSAHTARHLA